MKITVNNIELNIFAGAKVVDAIRMYYADKEQSQPLLMPEVKDAYGNIVAEDGALTEGSQLFIVEKNRCLNKIKSFFKK